MRRRFLSSLFVLAAAVSRSAAGDFVAPEIYPAASRAWTSAIGGALTAPMTGPALAPALLPLSAPLAEPARTFAPVAAQLQGPLGLAPAAFAALPAPEQRAALDLAVDEARGELQQTAAELDARSRALSAPGRALDKDGRAELFGVVARLSELRSGYGPLLDEPSRGLVEASYARALTRAVQVRDALIGRRAAELAGALSQTDGRAEAVAPVAAPADPALLPGVSARALKLYERMSETTAGWGADDIDALLTGFGFRRRDGKHRNYDHPDFPQLHDSYSHQRQLKDVYVKSALRLVRELARLRAQSVAAAPVRAPSGPADLSRVRLEDLAVLVTAEHAPPRARPVPAAPPAERLAAAAPAPPAAARPAPTRAAPTPRLTPSRPAAPAAKAEPPSPPAAESPASASDAVTRAKSWLRGLLKLDPR